MDDLERLHRSVDMLVNGWHERIEYRVRIGDAVEDRAKRIRHSALLVQLHELSLQRSSGSNNGGSTNKPGSRPPLNMAPLDLIDTITEEAQQQYHDLCTQVNGKAPTLMRRRPVTQTLHNLVAVAMTCEVSLHECARVAQMWVRKSRVMLGYDQPQALLKDTVCGTCGGALVVATDASTDVRCIGNSGDAHGCGQVYPRWQWLQLLAQGGPTE